MFGKFFFLPKSDQNTCSVFGDINEDEEALNFLAGVNASKSLKTVMYFPGLRFLNLQVF